MIIVFGSTTKGATERPLLDTHCYTCRRHSTWELFRLTEWMTGFFIPLFPVKTDRFLLCSGCRDSLQLTQDEVKQIKRLAELSEPESKALHDALVDRLEAHQLAGKTETQREYLKSERK